MQWLSTDGKRVNGTRPVFKDNDGSVYLFRRSYPFDRLVERCFFAADEERADRPKDFHR